MSLLKLAPHARQLLQRIARSNGDARPVRRAQILLEVDRQEKIESIAQRFGRSRQALYALVERYKARQGLPVLERICDQPRPGRPATKRQHTVAVVRQLLTQSPKRYHYRSPVWTVPMLRTQVQKRLKCAVSSRTVRRGLHELRQRFKRPRLVLALRPKTWRQAKGGLKTRLKGGRRTVILFLDSTIVTAVPPLRSMWAPIGQQARVPIIGSHDRRFLTGVINIQTGDYIDYISEAFRQEHFQEVLRLIRRHWRGWRIVLFLDRNSPHKAKASQRLAHELGIQLRWLPKACSELNGMDHLWRHVKNDVLANEPTPNVDATVRCAHRYVQALTPRERLHKAGALTEDFWLADVLR